MKLHNPNKEIATGITIVSLLLVLPWFSPGEYWIYILTVGFYYGILASSWSLLVGYVGRISFAHAAMSGLGAYASVLLSQAAVLHQGTHREVLWITPLRTAAWISHKRCSALN